MPIRRNWESVIIYGAGDHAKVILATIEAVGEYTIVGLLDDEEQRHGSLWYGYPVLGGCEQLPILLKQGVSRAFVAIGNNQARAQAAQLLKQSGFRLIQVVHPTATILRGSHLGEGVAILVNAFIGADALVGDNAIVSVGVTVGHDSIVGTYAQLCPGVRLAGGAKVGDFALLGMGVSVLPGITIGQRAIVGANAVVTKDIPAGATAVGIPAHIIRERP